MAWALPRATPQSVEAALTQWETLGRQGVPASSLLRTPDFLPIELAAGPDGPGELVSITRSGRRSAVREVAQRRLKAVEPRDLDGVLDLVGSGRLLALSVDRSDASAASMSNTRGLFSMWDAPPWDLWLTYVELEADEGDPYLVSWIPPSLTDWADIGVRVNPLRSLWWLDTRDDRFVRRVRAEGLLNSSTTN
jgi:hypothetical protein